MKSIVFPFAILSAAAIGLAACASSPVVSTTDDEVVIAVDRVDAGELSEALAEATESANDACGKMKKKAELDRTEDAAGGLVAYFKCVTPPPAAK